MVSVSASERKTNVDLHIISAQAFPQDQRRIGDAVIQEPGVKWRTLSKRYAEAAQRSRYVARGTEFAFLAFAAAAAAVVVFGTVQTTLVGSAAKLVHALDGEARQ